MPNVIATCLWLEGGVCDNCVVVCPNEAIHFITTRGGSRMAEIDTALCKDCGDCTTVCPGDAFVAQRSAAQTSRFVTLQAKACAR